MTAPEFVRSRQERWSRLETLLSKPPVGRRLRTVDMMLIGSLYRQLTSDLAYARREFPFDPVTPYLNQLATRAHTYVYRSQVVDLARMVIFVWRGFPTLVRQTAPFILVAFLCFALPAVPAFVATARDDYTVELLVPGGGHELLVLVHQGKLWFAVPPAQRSTEAAFIMSNNMRVALLAFAGGITLGWLTLYALVQNGIMLGSVAGLVQANGLSLGLWTFVASHGVIELTVIFISGGAGFRLAWSVLHPGLRPRREAIPAEGKAAASLMFGCIPLLIVAGTLEGFISPSGLPSVVKFGVSALTAVGLYSYLIFSGRPWRSQTGLRIRVRERRNRVFREKLRTSHDAGVSEFP